MRANEVEWHRRFLALAAFFSTWSKDPSTKVGACIVDDQRRVLGLGFNGFPRGVNDDEARYLDREVKYRMVVHAEANAILNATKSVEGATLYVTFPSCCDCAKLIIQSGIKRVIWQGNWQEVCGDRGARWASSIISAIIMYEEAGVEVIQL